MEIPKLPGERGLKWIIILAVVGVVGLVVGLFVGASALWSWAASIF